MINKKGRAMNAGQLREVEYVEIPTVSEDRAKRLARLGNKHAVPNAYRAPLPTVESAVVRAERLGLDLRFEPGQDAGPRALFGSAQQALLFAMTLDGNPARPVQSRMVDATNGSRELAGLDGAAQAGMILNALKGLGKLPVATMIASCTAPYAPMHLSVAVLLGTPNQPQLAWRRQSHQPRSAPSDCRGVRAQVESELCASHCNHGQNLRRPEDIVRRNRKGSQGRP
jgi:hypothetical protein